MKRVIIKIKDQYNNPALQTAEADDFTVVDGALLVFDDNGKVVASYAAGYWISAIPETKIA